MSNITDILWEHGTNKTLKDYQVKRLFFGYLRKIGTEGGMEEEERLMNMCEPGDFVTDINDWYVGGFGGKVTPIVDKYGEEDQLYLTGGIAYFDIYRNEKERLEYRHDVANIKKKWKKSL